MAEQLFEEIQPLLCRLSKENLLDICVATKAAQIETIHNKSFGRILNVLNNYLEESLDDEDSGVLLLNSVKEACVKFLSLPVPSGGSQGDEAHDAEGGSGLSSSEENEMKKLQAEISKMNDRLAILGQKSAAQSLPTPVNSFNMFKRELKIAGTITDSANKDKLSFCGLIRQINSAIAKGYTETEIIEAVIRAINPGNLLRGYLESMPLSDINLPKLRRLLRSHYKEKSGSELFQDLMNAAQQPKEDTQAFLMRLLTIRQKVLFVAQESDSKLKANTELVQSVFLQTLESGVQSENIRTRLRPVLEKHDVSDEEIIHQLSSAVSGEEDRQKRLQQAGMSKHARISKMQLEDDDGNRHRVGSAVKEEQKQQKDTEQIISAIQSLQKDMACLKERVERQPQTEGQKEEKAKGRPYGCQSCRNKGDGKNCNHCFKCGSTEHIAIGCKGKQVAGGKSSSSSENWRQPQLGGK